MKKIGILTFHYGVNFGGVLQCMALQNVLAGLGHEVEVINYVPAGFNSYYKNLISNLRYLKHQGLGPAAKRMKYVFSQNRNFTAFRKKYLNISGPVLREKHLDGLKGRYDVVIVGSDQVWGPSQHSKRAYFLDFEAGAGARKISYAPCCAVNTIKKENAEKLREKLLGFDALSVRNTETYRFVKQITGKEPLIVADPTVLYDFKELACDRNPYGDYILVYTLGRELQGGNGRIIEDIKRKYPGNKVVAVVLSEKFRRVEYADKTLYTSSPYEWINFIRNANFVFTDSFHGVIFALKYKKPLLSYYVEPLRASRFIDMERRYGLENFIVDSYEDYKNKRPLENNIDYDSIDRVLEKEREISLGYLKNSIEG